MIADHPWRWPDVLEATIAKTNSGFTRVIVLAETDSTQLAARRLHAEPGTIITAVRQTKGRARLGRAWADTGSDGIAVTFCLDASRAEHVVLAAPVAAAFTIESFLNRPVGIKWPNDVIVDSRKIAGILVERFDSIALLGIGINIAQTTWPNEIAHRAISVHQAGARDASRLDAISRLIATLGDALNRSTDEVLDAFRARDALTGTSATFLHDGREVRGRVGALDPARGLAVETANGPVWLPALTTSVLPAESP